MPFQNVSAITSSCGLPPDTGCAKNEPHCCDAIRSFSSFNSCCNVEFGFKN